MKVSYTLVAFVAVVLPSLASAQATTVAPARTPAVAAVRQTQGEKLFDPTRDAAKDIEKGIALAKKQNKRVILDVGGNWCPWCIKLDHMFKEDKEVAQFLGAHYVVVKVNWSQENENKAVLSKYPKIESFPRLFVLDSKGKLLQDQDTGLLETGDHHDHDKVMTFLKKWAK